MSKDLAKVFASRFIQRPDVKAVQMDRDTRILKQGDWFPDSKIDPVKRANSPHLPHGFKMEHLLAHIAGERTYGHYMLDTSDKCKLFAFDIDLIDKPEGNYTTTMAGVIPEDEVDFFDNVEIHENVNPRELWHDRKEILARQWYKYQLKHTAHILAAKVRELDIPCAVAYSGSKGVHVYGFTGSLPASEVREAALLVLDMVDEFEPSKGQHFWKHKNMDPVMGFGSNIEIEVFPKQDTLKDKSLGNLMRLPLGKNWKNPKDPTFFLDMTGPLADFKPHADPLKLLQGGDCFA
jgi:hypothetical protein